MNIDCINSLNDSEKGRHIINVLLIESNKQSKYFYPDNVQQIIPDENFNYNRFMNVGIRHSTADFVALCNNDILFSSGWFSEIVNFAAEHKNVLSFSPFDPANKYTVENYRIPNVYYGYGVRKEIAGWCIVVKREIFNIIGYCDETFDFYYVDDDYNMTLRKHALKHALITASCVKHLGGQVTKAVMKRESTAETSMCKTGDNWLNKNPKAMEGHKKFHKKWGSQRSIAMKNRFFKILSFLNKKCITNLVY
jgi:GT2 family glycosyltransferase